MSNILKKIKIEENPSSNGNINTTKEEPNRIEKESTESSRIWFDEIKFIDSNDNANCDWKPLPKRNNRKVRNFEFNLK